MSLSNRVRAWWTSAPEDNQPELYKFLEWADIDATTVVTDEETWRRVNVKIAELERKAAQ